LQWRLERGGPRESDLSSRDVRMGGKNATFKKKLLRKLKGKNFGTSPGFQDTIKRGRNWKGGPTKEKSKVQGVCQQGGPWNWVFGQGGAKTRRKNWKRQRGLGVHRGGGELYRSDKNFKKGDRAMVFVQKSAGEEKKRHKLQNRGGPAHTRGPFPEGGGKKRDLNGKNLRWERGDLGGDEGGGGQSSTDQPDLVAWGGKRPRGLRKIRDGNGGVDEKSRPGGGGSAYLGSLPSRDWDR